jgi:type II secretion system protein H
MDLLPMKKDKGFTLLEMLVVVAIIGIVSAIAVPNMFSFAAGMRLRSASRDLYSNFQMARIKAIRLNTRLAIRFTTSEYQVGVCKDNDEYCASGFLTSPPVKTVNMSQEYPGVSITNFDSTLVVFNSEGTSTDGGTTTLTNFKTTLTNSKGTSSVVAVALSGRIKITP